MAVTAITPKALSWNEFDVDALGMTAATAAEDGFTVDYGAQDGKILLVFYNSNASTTARSATVKAGNGIQGVADLASGDIAAGKYACVVVESGWFKNVSGDNKGKVIVISSHEELKMAAVVLP